MSARQVRRSFATPFIVTLAGSSLATVACGPKPLPRHENPPGPSTHTNPPEPHANPPAPDTKPEEPTAGTAPTTDPGTPAPPAPVKEPAKYEQKWTVMKLKGRDECSAMVDVQCPKPENGKPVPTCNPPPPIKYACPAGFEEGDTMRIILRAGATECFVNFEVRCPDNSRCNPPPPRKVPCPER